MIDSHLLGELVERITLHQLASGIGEESLSLARKVLIHNITHYSIQYGITQKLQALVVHRLALGIAVHDALVHQRHLVITDVVWIKT